jgi:prolipoprotein diacylglyceryltransferase
MFYFIPYSELRTVNLLGYPVLSWKLLLWMGLMISLIFLFREARKINLDKAKIFFIFVLQLFLMYFFAKLFFFISHDFLHNDGANFKITEFWRAGRIYAGTLFGFVLAVFLGSVFFKEKKQFLVYLDLFLWAHLIVLFFYRLGNVLYQSHIGKITTMPWGMEFRGEIRHETSIYEAISLLVLFLVVFWLRKKTRNSVGITTFFILGWMSLSRVITDFFRSDDLPISNFHFQNGLTLNQVFYFLVFVASVLGLFSIYSRIRFKSSSF